jgi:hypothetical protein
VDELKSFIALLRASGVTKYAGQFNGAHLELELGEAPAPEFKPDLAREGFVESNGRSPELNAALARLDPQYADPSLFRITEAQR